MKKAIVLLAGMLACVATSAFAFDFDFHGSMGDGKHDRYVPPQGDPVLNESPYITTELRPIYMYNKLPGSFPSNGGHINLFALQARVALTDRLGIIATKDGWANAQFRSGLQDETGFANIAAGLKYALYSDPKEKAILSLGVRYEAPVGNLKTSGIRLQGRGDGFIDTFLTGAKAFGNLGLQASVGYNQALDSDHDNSMVHFGVHADYELLPGFFPLIEVNGWSNTDNGNRTPLNIGGADLLNFGSTQGGTVAALNLGGRYNVTKNIQTGLGYMFPITNREEILDWRLTADVVFRY